jgi:hypothetical protein
MMNVRSDWNACIMRGPGCYYSPMNVTASASGAREVR